MRRIIIDTDTANDDTIAIMMALDLFDVVGITVVAGNVKFDYEVENALFTLEYLGRTDVPVYPGARRPIMGLWRTVEEVHGERGMGRWEIPRPSKRPEDMFASDAIIELSRKYCCELEIISIAPLTNLALAYLKDPSIVSRIRKVWVMGGAFSRGNTTEIAEFNFWVDPEAAEIVLNSGLNITIVPWEVAEETTTLTDEEWGRIADLRTRRSEFFIRVNEVMREYSKRVGSKGSVHPDSLTVSIAYDNSMILESTSRKVHVETCGRARGAMLIDWYDLGKKGGSRVEIVTKADPIKYRKYLLDTLSKP